MGIHILRTEQVLPIDIDKAWDFFSSPVNLSLLTPPEMDFRVLSDVKNKVIYEGMLIDYVLRPILGISVKWQTKIGTVIDKKQFTDTQNKGPYKLWEHTHYFEETNEGIKMNDLVRYELPLGFLGELAHSIFVRNKIKNIFKYRESVLNTLFNSNGKLDN